MWFNFHHPRISFVKCLVEMMGFEPMTPCLQGRCSPNWATPPYWCVFCCWQRSLMILQNWTTNDAVLESRRPWLKFYIRICAVLFLDSREFRRNSRCNKRDCVCSVLHRKEVIQPHLPIRLPCYDLTPIIGPTFDSCLQKVSSLASGVPNFHGLTGGVYKARERIHRGMLIRDY